MTRARLVITLLGCTAIVAVTAGARTVTAPASARSGATAVTNPIKHVAILYLENQSFDSILGYWCRHHSGRCPRGGMPTSITLSDGAVVQPHVAPDVVPIVTHDVLTQLTVMNIVNGVPQMNAWQDMGDGHCSAASHYRCITGYTPKQDPNLASLATKFAVSDAMFSLQDSPSFGGHLEVLTSNLDGFLGDAPHSLHGVPPGQGWGCDGDKVALWAATLSSTPVDEPSCIPDTSLTYKGAPLPNGGAFESSPVPYDPIITDELNKAGLTWTLYGGKCSHEDVASDGLETCTKADKGYPWAICPSIAECLYTQSGHMATPDQFVTDAKAGNLPNFSVITPAGSHVQDSEHNGFSITAGDDWIGQIASAVMHSPEWDSTALFITWDDCGCFYDQVPPGHNPDGSQRGPRIPLVIVSPYVKPGYTDSTATTFSGLLGYVEHTFGLAPLGPNDAKAYHFEHTFDYSQTPLGPIPMVNRPVPKGDHIDWAQARQDT